MRINKEKTLKKMGDKKKEARENPSGTSDFLRDYPEFGESDKGEVKRLLERGRALISLENVGSRLYEEALFLWVAHQLCLRAKTKQGGGEFVTAESIGDVSRSYDGTSLRGNDDRYLEELRRLMRRQVKLQSISEA